MYVLLLKILDIQETKLSSGIKDFSVVRNFNLNISGSSSRVLEVRGYLLCMYLMVDINN